MNRVMVGQIVFHRQWDGEFIVVSEPVNTEIVVIKDSNGNDIMVKKQDLLIDLNYIY